MFFVVYDYDFKIEEHICSYICSYSLKKCQRICLGMSTYEHNCMWPCHELAPHSRCLSQKAGIGSSNSPPLRLMKQKMDGWMDIFSYLDISEKILKYVMDRTLRARVLF